MSLARYRKMRDFAKTREPAGKAAKKRGHSYVIQKHDASHLHYDFRLELNGVLLSWAVPKGPSLDPSVKRLAMQTEDHPIEYGGFEGTIPKGWYGGGTVMVWDRGTWEPEGDAEESYRVGRLKFTLHGEKLKGSWHLVRTARGDEKKKSWLLFKATDEEARPGDASLLERQAKSALTGRNLSEIAAGKGGKRSWKSDRDPDFEHEATKPRAPRKVRVASAKSRAKAGASRARRAHQKKIPDAKEIAEAVRAPLPRKIEAELATLVSEPPSGDDFIHEVKFDGYR
ncbi:MAG TPA: DNA polymerase ligase N-terminal domain-containing protein, partial [Polyangiaceae bacterium]